VKFLLASQEPDSDTFAGVYVETIVSSASCMQGKSTCMLHQPQYLNMGIYSVTSQPFNLQVEFKRNMLTDTIGYSLFFKFIETYAPAGFKGIGSDDPLMVEIEKMTEKNNQFFYVGDVVQMKIFHTSKRSTQLMGIEPADISPYHFFEATHPDDLNRHSLGRAEIFKLAHDLFLAEKGSVLLSTNFKIRNAAGGYSNLLMQLYLFYNTIPYKSVFVIKVHTNIDWCKKMKYGFHYYLGNNLSCFRYPDEELLKMSVPFSDREFEIIRLISSGMGSEQIAEKLFLSVHTVNTHRKNILSRAGKENMSELIHDLILRGVL
jgi:DNA-binding CsgD family transcriptional regulator